MSPKTYINLKKLHNGSISKELQRHLATSEYVKILTVHQTISLTIFTWHSLNIYIPDLKNKIKKTFVWHSANNHKSISLPTCVMLAMLNLLVLDYKYIKSSASLIFTANLKTIHVFWCFFFIAKRRLTVVYRRRNTFSFQ